MPRRGWEFKYNIDEELRVEILSFRKKAKLVLLWPYIETFFADWGVNIYIKHHCHRKVYPLAKIAYMKDIKKKTGIDITKYFFDWNDSL